MGIPWASALLFLTLVLSGYALGLGLRPVRIPGMPHSEAGLAGGVAGLRGDLTRMIAMRGDGSEPIGINDEAFPNTLDGYWKAMNIIAGQFYNPTPLSMISRVGQANLSNPRTFRQKLTYSAIQGVMSSLDDPYTRFLDPTAYKEMQQDNAGSFAGIGAQLTDKNSKIVIVKTLPDTPAAAAHLMPMDVIVGIDGKSADLMNSETAVQAIRGKPGTEVTLRIRRGNRLLTVRIVRAIIRSQHFDWKVIDGNIGYMHLMMFDEQAADNIQHAMQTFRRVGVKGLILDLRDNPGGLLNAAVDVASEFIPPGTVVWVQERGGQRNALTTNADAPKGKRLPLVVLVNHYSASASEIVSGAIKDTGAGTLVGITTWGKGLVQEVIPLNDNSALALTTAHYFTPNGSDINLKGVKPDVVVGHDLTDTDVETPQALNKLIKERDAMDKAQLDRGIELLKQQISQRR